MRVEGSAEELSVGDTLQRHQLRRNRRAAARCRAALREAGSADRRPDREEGRASSSPSTNGTWCASASKRGSPSCARPASACCRRSRASPFVPVSALTGKGIDRLMAACLRPTRCGTSGCPRMRSINGCDEAVEAHPPPAVSGRRIKLRYITQSNARPPTFVLFCSRPKALPDSYVALSGQRLARELRPSRRADQAESAQRRQPLRQGRMHGR